MFTRRVFTANQLCKAIYDLVDENLHYFTEIKRPIDPLETRVVYRREPPGQNQFLNVRDMMQRGYGDCEDLAAWLVAYFISIDISARPVLQQQSPTYYHITCEAFVDGKWVQIDPSRLKGM